MASFTVYQPTVHLDEYKELKEQVPKLNALLKSCTAIFRKHGIDIDTLRPVINVLQEHYYAELYEYGDSFADLK